MRQNIYFIVLILFSVACDHAEPDEKGEYSSLYKGVPFYEGEIEKRQKQFELITQQSINIYEQLFDHKEINDEHINNILKLIEIYDLDLQCDTKECMERIFKDTLQKQFYAILFYDELIKKSDSRWYFDEIQNKLETTTLDDGSIQLKLYTKVNNSHSYKIVNSDIPFKKEKLDFLAVIDEGVMGDTVSLDLQLPLDQGVVMRENMSILISKEPKIINYGEIKYDFNSD